MGSIFELSHVDPTHEKWDVLPLNTETFWEVTQGYHLSSRNSSPCNPVIILPEELRNKLMPGEPAVKILQRPSQTQNGCKCPNGDVKPKAPFKSLQQREMEYAEARLRILGEARSPEESESPTGGSPLDDRIPRIQGKTEMPKPDDNCAGIIRLPKGPDGTPGFTLRR